MVLPSARQPPQSAALPSPLFTSCLPRGPGPPPCHAAHPTPPHPTPPHPTPPHPTPPHPTPSHPPPQLMWSPGLSEVLSGVQAAAMASIGAGPTSREAFLQLVREQVHALSCSLEYQRNDMRADMQARLQVRRAPQHGAPQGLPRSRVLSHGQSRSPGVRWAQGPPSRRGRVGGGWPSSRNPAALGGLAQQGRAPARVMQAQAAVWAAGGVERRPLPSRGRLLRGGVPHPLGPAPDPSP
jgi:hypothetical protein